MKKLDSWDNYYRAIDAAPTLISDKLTIDGHNYLVCSCGEIHQLPSPSINTKARYLIICPCNKRHHLVNTSNTWEELTIETHLLYTLAEVKLIKQMVNRTDYLQKWIQLSRNTLGTAAAFTFLSALVDWIELHKEEIENACINEV